MGIYMLREYDWLCFTANSAGSTVKIVQAWYPTAVTLETSTDWSTRTTYTIWNTITLTNIGDNVFFRNTSTTDTWFSTSTGNKYVFRFTWSVAGSWDVCYLLNKNSTTTLSNYCFYWLFESDSELTSAPKISATTYWQYSCGLMFQGSGIVTAPSILATTLDQQCCYRMFMNCKSLEELPALPALALKYYCYWEMFEACTKIKISQTQTWEYQTPYRIPTEWTWTYTNATYDMYLMFYNTWWTFKSPTNPNINTTYYTSNTVV